MSLDGGAGDDYLSGGSGDNILIGGTGRDELSGGEGTTTYRFSSGFGQDVIWANDGLGGTHRIEFDASVTSAQIEIRRERYAGPDLQVLILKVMGTEDRIVLNGAADLFFADGTSWSYASMVADALPADGEILTAEPGQLLFEGTAGADVIDGGFGDDLLVGGGSNDTLFGGDGDDELTGGTGDDWLRGWIWQRHLSFLAGLRSGHC